MTLRRALTLLIGALLVIALAAAAALVVLTSRLHLTTASLGRAMELVQLAEESLLDLRAIDALAARRAQGDEGSLRSAIAQREASLRQRLADLGERADTEAMRELLARARSAGERFAVAAGAPASGGADGSRGAEMRAAFEEARAALREFQELNVERARRERAAAARWDRTADAWGFGAAALLLVGTAIILVLLRSRVFEPMIAITESIARYGHGEVARRAPEAGPEELRDIARSFNEVADRLQRQRDDQLAFLAGVAHDLRNPLSAIRLACARRLASDGDPERARARLELIERQVGKLERLATDFLDAARAEAGQLELVLEDHDLRLVARSAVELFATTSAAHRLELQEPDEPLVARCDVGRIEQVVNNLVGNAIKYSPDGGEVRVALRADGAEAVISVEDEGVGIAPDDLARIFLPFRRGSRLTTVVPGLGLGLATSRRIAGRHGGTLTASSTPGAGSRFELRIPLAGPAAVRARAAARPRPAAPPPAHRG